MFPTSKKKQIETQISQYNSQVADCMEVFKEALEQYCSNPDREAIRGTHAVRLDALGKIALGGMMTPVISLVFAAAGYAIFLNGQ